MDLSTTYLGLRLKNPLIASASPLTAELDSIRELEDAGAAAVVLHSLFEEQITHEAGEIEYLTRQGTESYAEALSYFPEPEEYRHGPEEYVELIRAARAAVKIPVIASLNGVTPGGWINCARELEQAGADALELNVYYIATDPQQTGAQVEQLYLDILQAVKRTVRIPVAMKLGPYFSAMANMAVRLEAGGADGLVLFNRFYQPDFNLDELEVVPDLVLSTPFESRLPLRWIAILRGHLQCSLAATSGLATGHDVAKMLLAGADATQFCSVLLRRGPRELGTILKDLRAWMDEKEYASVQQMRGAMSQKSVANPAAFERANYMRTLNSYAS